MIGSFYWKADFSRQNTHTELIYYLWQSTGCGQRMHLVRCLELTAVRQKVIVEVLEGFSHFLGHRTLLIIRAVLEVSQQKNLHTHT